MSVNLEQLSESLSSLTVLELAELSKKLEEKWGVSAASFANAGPAAGSVAVGTDVVTGPEAVWIVNDPPGTLVCACLMGTVAAIDLYVSNVANLFAEFGGASPYQILLTFLLKPSAFPDLKKELYAVVGLSLNFPSLKST